MRKLILATTAIAGLVGAAAVGASAAPVVGSVAHPGATAQHQMVTNVQYDEYHHGHHWHHWHHRYWEHGHWRWVVMQGLCVTPMG